MRVLRSPYLLLYVPAVAGAQAITTFVGAVPGASAYAFVLLALLAHHVGGRDRREQDALVALTLVPLAQLTILAVAKPRLTGTSEEALALAPLAVALGWSLIVRRLPCYGLRSRSWLLEILTALAGIPLGIAAVTVLLAPSSTLSAHSRAGSVLLVGVVWAIIEEVMFRGVIQRTMSLAIGPAGVVVAALLYGIAYVGATPWEYFLFMTGVGLVYGSVVQKTGSIAGVLVSHVLLNVTLLILWTGPVFA